MVKRQMKKKSGYAATHMPEVMVKDIKRFVEKSADYRSVMSVVEAGARLKILELRHVLEEAP